MDIVMMKAFLMFAGIWNFFDGIISIRLEHLGHSKLSDLGRLIRSLIGVGLLIIGFYL
jgi:hypothetical protein